MDASGKPCVWRRILQSPCGSISPHGGRRSDEPPRSRVPGDSGGWRRQPRSRNGFIPTCCYTVRLLNTTGKNMKLKHLLTVAICSAGLFAPQFIRAQGLVYLSNTNEPVEGTYQDPLGVIQFVTGPNASGYTLTAVSVLLGDNPGTEITNTHIDIYSSTPASIGNPLAQVFLGPFPRDAGLHTFTAEPDIILPPNAYYTLTVNPIHDAPFYNYSIIFDYTTSTNASGTGGWGFYAPGSHIGSSLGVYPLFN